MVKLIDFKALESQCMPCAHCGTAKPSVSHQDYIGDYYVGNKFQIACGFCGIHTEFEEWKRTLVVWNSRAVSVL